MIPYGETCDALADTLNDPRGFVTQDAGKEALGIKAIESVGVGVAQRNCGVLHANLSLLGWAHLHLHQLQGLLGLEGDRGQAFDLYRRTRRNGRSWCRVDAGARKHAGVRTPAQNTCQVRRVVLQVVRNEGGDEVEGVVVALLHAQAQVHPILVTGLLQLLRPQLILQEVVGSALVDKQSQVWALVLLDQLHCVVLLPGFFVSAKVQREGLLAPRCVGGVADWREGRHRAEGARVLQGDGEGSVASHAVPQDARLLWDDWQQVLHGGRQLLRDVVEHVVMLFVLVSCGIQVESSSHSEVVGVRVLIWHIITAGGGVGNDEHKAKGRCRLEGASFLGVVLIGAGQTA
mmetsp:Transcript_58311/g.104741  ORF Transcript_58311/g.104741 Transcript_58311/m.104741 type:complete len:346 (-) Transcript_58311:243-1280(-)